MTDQVPEVAYDRPTINARIYGLLHRHAPPHKDFAAVDPYSSEVKFAWQVVETMRDRGWSVQLVGTPLPRRLDPDLGWTATFTRADGEAATVTEEVAPLAICLAALKTERHEAHKEL